MGTDLTLWPYSWEPAQPPRLAYYGGLASHHNQQGALRCFNHIMPAIWRKFPQAELWLVGSNPPESLRALASDPRIKVTGYIENVQQVLRTMSAVLCPFTGTYGFRSRLIEVMALGVPVVATPDAVYGMELENRKGMMLGQNDGELARQALQLLGDSAFAHEQSRLAREQMTQLFSIENTYERLMHTLYDWLEIRKVATS
jgi:glycosyltransferase involved in cell wall biosynthesis